MVMVGVPAAQATPGHRPFEPGAYGGGATGLPAAEVIKQAHGSEAFTGRHADMTDNPSTLGRSNFAIQHIDGPVDLGEAAVFHRLAVIADPGHAA